MKPIVKATLASLALAGVVLVGVQAYGQQGPGFGYGPGWMMEQGYGPGAMMGYGPGAGRGPGGMMGSGWGMGYGPHSGRGFGPGAGLGYGPCAGLAGDKDLDTADVTKLLERHLARQGNDRLKLGEVKEVDKNTIVAEIVTQDGSLVDRLSVDRDSGRIERIK
ncbi:MAG: hypothetical protein HY521_03390 [Proteobacteria bacterium]|nr:hypothetical protein [Pseudomonadota bacterium]